MLAEAVLDAELTETLSGDFEAVQIPSLSESSSVEPAGSADDPDDAAELQDIEKSRGKTPPSELEIAIGEFIQSPDTNKTRIDKLARLMFNDARVRKICRLRAMKKGVDLDEVDDVIQRTMEVFFSKMLVKMRSPEAVYAVVYAVADNVSKEVSREAFAMISGHDSIEVMRENGEELRESDHAEYEEADRELQVDARIRKSRTTTSVLQGASGGFFTVNAGLYQEQVPLVDLVPGKPLPKGAQAAAPVVVPKPPKGAEKPARELSKDQQALVNIIDKLEMRNQDFAVHLGIGLPRLSSYIYGRTASVPKEVMDKARAVFEEQSKSHETVKQHFSKPMNEIIADWERRLETETNEQLANYLGVTTMTIHRWRTNETQPDLTALVRYDQQVSDLVLRMNNAKAQMDRQVSGKK